MARESAAPYHYGGIGMTKTCCRAAAKVRPLFVPVEVPANLYCQGNITASHALSRPVGEWLDITPGAKELEEFRASFASAFLLV
jgi:hypothetical protein